MPAFFLQCFWKLLKASEVGVQGQSSGLWFRKITSTVVEKEDGCGGTCELRRGMQKWQAQRAKQPFSGHAGVRSPRFQVLRGKEPWPGSPHLPQEMTAVSA